MNGNDGMIHRGRGLVDLIAGVTPTFSGWTADPTNAANITDGDISTFCNTGNKVCDGAWQYCYFEWDLGAMYDIVATIVGATIASAGNPEGYLHFWNGSAWIWSDDSIRTGGSIKVCKMRGARCSKVRIGLTSSAASTITTNIREFHAWRL